MWCATGAPQEEGNDTKRLPLGAVIQLEIKKEMRKLVPGEEQCAPKCAGTDFCQRVKFSPKELIHVQRPAYLKHEDKYCFIWCL